MGEFYRTEPCPGGPPGIFWRHRPHVSAGGQWWGAWCVVGFTARAPHICVTREDAEKFGELKTHRDGTRTVYVQDPSGNMVEVLKP